MSIYTDYEDLANEFSSEGSFEKREKRERTETPANRKFGRRRSPKQFNGIHRRRTKKIKW